MTKLEAIKQAVENMDESAAVALWNEYCDTVKRYDDRVEYMESLPEMFGDDIFNILNRFYFGYDYPDEKSSANPNRDYFYFNGYGNIVSTDYPTHSDIMDIDEMAEYIAENDNAFYNDDIQEIIDEYEGE